MCNISLRYKGDCALSGVTSAGEIVAEEFDDDHWMRHRITLDCELVQSGDLDEPDMLLKPSSPTTHALNYSGVRYRGMREDDRVAEWVQPLTIMEKMPLLPYLKLNIPPMLLLGIAESHVTSEARISDTLSVVCRRVRLAYTLAQPQVDEAGLPYDYDTLVLHVAHLYEDDSEVDLAQVLAGIDGIQLQRPLDCIVYENKLIIADASDGEHNSRIVVFRIATSPASD